jgi:threonylcarbamoyladenosine tRNA methylthiotransferase MtaB
MPDATFTTDVIVGFPGETDEAFANTLALIEEIGFIKLHIFKFSPRPGTAAAAMKEQISDAVKDARSQALFALEHRLFQQHARQLVGTDVSVLVERTRIHGEGLTPHYLRVCAPFSSGTEGKICTATIQEIGENCLLGSPIN